MKHRLGKRKEIETILVTKKKQHIESNQKIESVKTEMNKMSIEKKNLQLKLCSLNSRITETKSMLQSVLRDELEFQLAALNIAQEKQREEPQYASIKIKKNGLEAKLDELELERDKLDQETRAIVKKLEDAQVFAKKLIEDDNAVGLEVALKEVELIRFSSREALLQLIADAERERQSHLDNKNELLNILAVILRS